MYVYVGRGICWNPFACKAATTFELSTSDERSSGSVNIRDKWLQTRLLSQCFCIELNESS